jgi:hypothetical protein
LKRKSKLFYSHKIGFDDRLIALFIIPIIAFIIPIVFFGRRFNAEPLYNWRIYYSALVITFFNWIGDRYLIIWARNKYPNFEDTKKRLIFQTVIILVYMLVVTNILGFLLDYFFDVSCDSFYQKSIPDVLIDSNSASIFCTLCIAAVYETRYFMTELKNSIQEKEMFKRESLEAQLSALKTQVNPHFLFNNLNTLCAIIPDEPKMAVNFVQQLSKVYRHILEVKDEQYVELAHELEVIQSYAFLLKTRFGNNLNIMINVGEEQLKRKVIPLAVQLLMENAIKHNVISIDRNLSINIYTENNYLIITNNLQLKNMPVDSTSLGLNNIRNRYKLITDLPVVVVETETNFTASIPLLD